MKEINKLLFVLLNREDYIRLKEFIPTDNLPPQISRIINILGEYYRDNPTHEEVSASDFKSFFAIRCPTEFSHDKIYDSILTQLVTASPAVHPDSGAIVDNLKAKALAADVQTICQSILDGKTSDVINAVTKIRDIATKHVSVVGNKHASMSDIVTTSFDDGDEDYDTCYPWFNEEITEFVGWYSNHLTVWGGAPDTGKTAAIIGQCVFQARYLNDIGDTGKLIIFSNEQGVVPMIRRLKSCILEQPFQDWSSDREAANIRIEKILGSHDRILFVDAASYSTLDIETTLDQHHDVKGIYIDQLHKVKWPGKSSSSMEVDRLSNLFMWARDISKSVAPIQTVHQLGVQKRDGYSGAPRKFLDMDAFYGIRTMLQGEADVIITMNAPDSSTDPNLLYCKVAKTKVYGPHHKVSKSESAREFFMTINRPLSRLEGIPT